MTYHPDGRAFYVGLLEALTRVMGSANAYLRDHGPRVAMLAARIGDEMSLGREEVSRIFFAGVLADMGMVGLAEDAWEHAVPELPPHVRSRVKRHPIRSEEWIRSIPHFGALAPLVRHHHEWWDGTGYPDALRGDEIPPGAQILRLSDTVAALSQDRPARRGIGRRKVLEVVEGGIGREFGPDVAGAYGRLRRAGGVSDFDATEFRHGLERAAVHVLPEQVPPLSIDQFLAILANLVDGKDPYTAGHSRRVALLAVAVAGMMGLQDEMKATLWAEGYLHDLGKLGVPVRILAKRGRLTDEEFAVVKRHPSDGARILETIPSLRHLSTGAKYHHERWDGTGYPEGLSGDDIPFVAQIMAVCDAYDAMTSWRAYRDSRSHPAALKEVEEGAGVQFSPVVADAFLALPRTLFETIRSEPPERPERIDRLLGSTPFLLGSEPREAARAVAVR